VIVFVDFVKYKLEVRVEIHSVFILSSNKEARQMLFLLIVVVLLWLLYQWSTSKHDLFRKAGLPFEKPWPLVGNMLNVLLGKESVITVTQKSYDNFKKSK